MIVDTLEHGGDRIAPDDRDAAERSLIDAATGAPRTPDDAGAARTADDTGEVAPCPPDALRPIALAWLAAFDPDGLEPRDEQHRAERSFTLSRRPDGMVRGTLLCTPEHGAVIQTVLDAHTTPRKPDTTPDTETATEDPEAAEGAEVRTHAQRQHDALLGIVTEHARSGDAPTTGNAAPTLVVTVTKDQLDAAAAGAVGQTATIERSGDHVPVALAARMLCDANIHIAALASDGHVLSLARTRRLFTPAQRRSIALRDRGCTGPGCSAPPGWCETHHVIPWNHGGPTDITNALLLCSRCHHDVHRGRLRISKHPTGSGWRVRHALRPPPRRHQQPTFT